MQRSSKPDRHLHSSARQSPRGAETPLTLNLDIFWLKEDGHIDPDSLPPPDEVAAEIVENLESALEKFRSAAASLARA